MVDSSSEHTTHTHHVGQVLHDAYRAHADKLAAYICFQVRSSEDAEDILHEVFIVASVNFVKWDPTKSIKSWLYGIAQKLILNHNRKKIRRKTYASDKMELHKDEARHEQLAENELVQRAFATLDVIFKEVLWLSDAQGFSAKEIGHILSISPNTVSSRIRLGRSKLRDAYLKIDHVEGGADK